MKRSLLLFSILTGLNSFAQSYFLDTNSIAATIETKGVLFNNSTAGSGGFEALAGSGVNSIYASSLWMAGVDPNGQLKGAIGSFGLSTESYTTGPLTVVPSTGTAYNEPYGPAVSTTTTQQNYNQIFTVTSAELNEFINWSNCKNDPLCDENVNYPNYSIPASIMNWPAHGDVSLYQDFFLAPFYDLNGDGIYDPNNGDHPCIKGDKYALIIMNDKNPNNTTIDPIGVEIHTEVYAYDLGGNSPVDRTIFVTHNIINRSTQTLHDFHIGVFADFDIGCSSDDYVGSIPELNAFFGYNSGAADLSCPGSSGYGSTPPAQGIAFLNKDMSSSLSFTSGGSLYHSLPSTSSEHFECLKGNFKDSTPMYYGGDGHTGSSGVTTNLTSFHYPENPPLGYSTWTEYSRGNPGGDRTMIGVVDGDTLVPGETVVLDLAYIFSRSTTGDQLASIQTLQNDIPVVQQFYDTIPDCYTAHTIAGINDISIDQINIYPNPFTDEIKFDNLGKGNQLLYEIYNSTGQLVCDGIIPPYTIEICNVKSLSHGTYLAKIYNSDRTSSYSRVVVK